MEAANPRLRVVFEDGGMLSKSQKKEGLKHSWLLLKPQLRTISDLTAYLLHFFHLHQSCPSGIIVYMDGFVLPPFESTAIFKDKDLIRVKKKGTKLHDVTRAIRGVDTFVQDETIEKQPLVSNIKLLANEEYNKEAGGYESETDDGEDVAKENILALEDSPHGDMVSKKRKASNRVESSKTKAKKRKHMTPESVEKNVVNQCELARTPEKKRVHEKENKKDAISRPEVVAKGTKNLKPLSDSKDYADQEENGQKAAPISADSRGTKKVSRSTRRKAAKRFWAKENRAKDKMQNHQSEEQPEDPQTDLIPKMDVSTNIIENKQADENSGAEDNLVPVMIRPGHIRFTPSSKVKDVQENLEEKGSGVRATENGVCGDNSMNTVWGGQNNQGAKETFQWNGITNKRKGQKWGTEKRPTSSWKDSRDYDVSSSIPPHGNTSSHEDMLQEPIYSNGITSNKNGEKWDVEKQPSSTRMGSRGDDTHCPPELFHSKGVVDFEKLVPLTDSPKAGDLIAYRLVELSSTWCPELSSFRVGKVSWFQSESNRILLVPDPEYPLDLEKKIDNDNDNDNDNDDDSGQPPEFSLYNEDGSLEIDFPSLVDVRVVKRSDLNQPVPSEAALANALPVASGASNHVNETQGGNNKSTSDSPILVPANGKKDAWDEITEALSAKKAELAQENGWDKKRSWSRRGSALGPIMNRLRAQNAI